MDNIDLLLTPKEFAVLFLFMENEGTIISAEAVYENVWKLPLGNNINALKMIITKLRKKLMDCGYEITVIRSKGYIFERV